MTASDTIEKTFRCFYKKLLDDPDLTLDHTLPPGADVLAKSIRLANRTICNHAAQDSELGGMGTTIVAVAFEADVMSLAHVGDSRAYRVRGREIDLLTEDHSVVFEEVRSGRISPLEARTHPLRNRLPGHHRTVQQLLESHLARIGGEIGKQARDPR